jgi:hypothetical protein
MNVTLPVISLINQYINDLPPLYEVERGLGVSITKPRGKDVYKG